MDDLNLVLKERRNDSHKGENGRLLVIGGCSDYIGAPALVGLSALRTGVDMVVIAAPEKVAWQINSYSPDLITKKMKGEHFTKAHAREIFALLDRFDVIAIGNGIGQNPETVEFVREVVHRVTTKPKVIDADAIKALRGIEVVNAIMTPHAKEFEIFTGQKLPANPDERKSLIGSFARKDLIMLVKGKEDIVTDGSKLKVIKGGNPGMTVGGTGDVLAGICAGLLCHGGNKFNVACAASVLNKHIGNMLYTKSGYGFTASDMVWEIPGAMKNLSMKQQFPKGNI